MARGKTRGHKGGRKQFSNPDQIKDDMAKEEEKRLWREQHPDSESEESSEEEQAKAKECFCNSPTLPTAMQASIAMNKCLLSYFTRD